jgi:hypothetical protein
MEVKAYENQIDFVKNLNYSIPTDEIFDLSGFRVRWAEPLSLLPPHPKAIVMALKDGASQQQQNAPAQFRAWMFVLKFEPKFKYFTSALLLIVSALSACLYVCMYVCVCVCVFARALAHAIIVSQTFSPCTSVDWAPSYP